MIDSKKEVFFSRNVFLRVFLFGLLFIFFVSSLNADISWKENLSLINFTLEEDSIYQHNFTENLSIFVEGDLLFEIVDEGYVWFNGERILFESLDWISFNTTSGIMEFSPVEDDQTGFLEISILAANSKKEGSSISFRFEISAVNDAPEFLNFSDSISRYTQGDLNITFSATDEEEHYPLNFSISFNDCSLAFEGDCNLNYSWESVLGKENTSSVLIFENLTREHKGKYNITVCVNDSLPEEESLPEYLREDYNISKQSCRDFILDLRSPLNVTDINCSGISMKDDEVKFCQIRVETEFENSSLHLSSNSNLVNSSFDVDAINHSWFYSEDSVVSQGYEYLVNISVAPSLKKEVGNWTIEFTVNDVSDLLDETSSPVSINLSLFVNRSSNDVPNVNSLTGLKEFDFFVDSSEEVIIRIEDEDLRVPDKGVYNESFYPINFLFVSQSDPGKSFSGDYNFSMDDLGDYFRDIYFYPNPTEEDVGLWSINVTAMDASGDVGFFEFNLTVLDNTPPVWESYLVNISCIVPADKISVINCTYFNGVENIPFDSQSLNFSNSSNGINWASDNEQIELVYSLVGDCPVNFNLNSSGFLNFTPWKEDVGEWDFEILVNDGVLSDVSRWVVSINNTNSAPGISSLTFSVGSGNLSAVSSGGVATIPQSKEISFLLNVQDEDFLVPNSYENLSANIVFTNVSSGERIDNFFNFSFLSEDNSAFSSSFFPLREDVGEYNVTINVSDSFGSFVTFDFLLNISVVYSPPVISELFNQSSAVGRNFSYFVNASDIEGGNLSYNYSLLSETYFGRDTSSQEIFDKNSFENSGEFNLTFNESHAGVYAVNVSVKSDVSNLYDSQVFWIFVYDIPKVIFPENGFSFSGIEGNSSIFNFSANHSVGNELIYEVYSNLVTCLDESTCLSFEDRYKKGNVTGEGDGEEYVPISIEFDHNDENYGNISKYLELVVYPSDSNLEDSLSLKKTFRWSLEVNHSNAPMNFTKVIGSFSKQHTEKVNISLSEHFSDIDSSDNFYNQLVEFEVISNNEEGSDILINGVRLNTNFVLNATSYPEDWMLEFGCREGVVSLNETLTIIGYDLNEMGNRLTNVSSNDFVVEFYPAPEIVKTITTSTSRSIEVPFFMKLVVPGQVSGASKESIVIPLEIFNNGKRDLNEITLFAEFESEKDFSSSVSMQFSESFFGVLRAGEKRDVLLTVNKGPDVVGEYSILINASSKSPEYSDWGRVQVVLPEVDSFLERIIFAETFISENYECLEIREVTSRARKFYDEAKYSESLREANLAIDACRVLIGKDFDSLEETKVPFEEKIFKYFVFFLGISFFAGIGIYIYRRNKLKFVGD